MIIGLLKEFLAWRRRRKARLALATRTDESDRGADTATEDAIPGDGGLPVNAKSQKEAREEPSAPVILERQVEVDEPVSGALPGGVMLDEGGVQDGVEPGAIGRVLRSRRATPGRQ